ncbi:hypothetical protein ACSV5M_08745 [Cellvibrio sp. ARAG 10.3]|uniref:hypothetical protein n=1 Tax=Cellvibrio sp. ARAG 10.3 TaxID=3451358 RepID=UPI003F45C136
MKSISIIVTTALISSFGTYCIVQQMADDSALAAICEMSGVDLADKKNTDVVAENIEIVETYTPQQHQPPSLENRILAIPSEFAEPEEKKQSPSIRSDKDIQDQINAFRNQLDKLKDASPLQHIQQRYTAEPVDYEWAIDKENAILTLFDTSENLHSFMPLDVSCKSKNCEIVLAAGDEQQTDFMYDALLKAVTSNRNFPDQTVSYFADPATGQMIVYVSRNGVLDLLQ